MVIQSESRPGYNSAYQVQASHLAAPGGYGGHAHGGHAHGGHAHHGGHLPHMKPSGPLSGVLGGGLLDAVLGGGPLGGSPGYSSQHGGPAGNVQSYTNYFESSKYSGGALQPHLHGGAGYGSYGSSAPCHGGTRVESTNFAYTNSGRPAYTNPGQETWNFKSIESIDD